MKKYLLTLALLLLFITPSFASPITDKITQLIQCYESQELQPYYWSKFQYPGTDVQVLIYHDKENTALHSNFDWKWSIHEMGVFTDPSIKERLLIFARDDYQEFISPDSRGFETMVIKITEDGQLFEEPYKSYTLTMQDHIIMLPDYPIGYINREWNKVSPEEQQEFINHELDYWLEVCNER
jgi:hypothetical protein